MSVFVAIPSGLDLKKGFTRLNVWILKTEWIYIDGNGSARKSAPASNLASGLVLISLAYLKQDPTPKTGADLIKKADGVLIHPGGTDTPTLADAERAMEDVPDEIRYNILAKTVAFTRSGAGDYQIDQLTRVWNWMSGNPREGEAHKIDKFDLGNIENVFAQLRRKQGRDAIVRACLLAQGSFDADVAKAAREEFTKELRNFLTPPGEGSWLKSDPQLGAAVEKLLYGEFTRDKVVSFLEVVREHYGEKTR